MYMLGTAIRIVMNGVFVVVALISLFRPSLVLRIMYGSRRLSMKLYAIRSLQMAAGLSLVGVFYSVLAGMWR
jgi:hypothetical protein